MSEWNGYQMLLELGVDADVAAYVSGIDECHCVMPEQSCQMCRGAAKVGNGPTLIEAMAPGHLAVTATGDYIVVCSAGRAVVADTSAGLQVLVDGGYYLEYPCHIGGRTTPLFVAEPAECCADGPTFMRMHPEPWRVVPQTERS